MRFVRAVWKLLVGIKDALVLLLLLLFFGALWAALSQGPQPIGEGVLLVDLDGTLVEQPSRPSASALVGGGSVTQEHRLRDVVAALDAAQGDDRIKAVAIDLERFVGGGQSAVATLGDAVDRVRKSGKPVLAYATGYSDDGYQLAAHASEVWLNPLGAVLITGPGGNNLYFKGLLDKLGVTANVYRVGTYKAAVEPFTRSDMSPEARANAQALGGALLETWRDDVRGARPAAAASIDAYLRDPVGMIRASGGDMARAALAAKLVDRAGERRAFEARLAELGGEGDDAIPYRQVKLSDYLKEVAPGDSSGPIGVVTIAGTIVDGKAGPGSAGGDSIAKLIDEGVATDRLKALVVRIDSPGGSVMASERIRQSILAAKQAGLPVVASMGNVAASGGYWVAAPADVIMAEPSTVTGSIGVFGILPSFEGSLTKLGLGADGIKTTPLSGEPDLLNGPSPAADALIQAGVESVYRRFLAIVAASRKKSPAEIDRIAQGRVWDGGTARQLGLIDQFGGLDEAIAKAANLAKIEDRDVTWLDQPPSFEDRLLAMLAGDDEAEGAPRDVLAALAPSPGSMLARALDDLRVILAGPSIQVRCLECPPSPSGAVLRAPAVDGAWWRLLG
ncbi:MAG: signal peptide peptidase SppA [Pseudomonadota bacterium]|nr:signal peptide peptidase SppA [Pseudomonadota bacterium]